MEEQVARFVARDDKPPLPAPRSDASYWGTARKNLFATPTDTILTLLASTFIVYFGWKLLNWAWFDAVFEGSDRTACLVEDGGHGGACWAFVKARFEQFIYGTYPIGERWRVNVVFFLLAALVVPIAVPSLPYKRLNAILLFAVFPVVTLVLLTGGEFSLGPGMIVFLILLAAVATFTRASGRREASWSSPMLRAAGGLALASFLLLLGSNIVDSSEIRFLGVRFSMLALLALFSALASIAAAVLSSARNGEGSWSAARLLAPLGCVLVLLFVMTADFGLPDVRTSLWGGLLVTLVVALSGIAASLPLGILLALGRRSNLPAVRFLCIVFIEFWRGVPLITVLFMANFMLPLLMPEGVNFNQLLRVLIGVALFSAAYMAEVVRGGLQAIPKGQYEGADAMALTYWQKMRMIILPQALTLVIPGIVNTFIGLFKDTSLVYIIGLADLLGTVRRGFTDPNWITPATPATGLVFAAFIFWLFCFGMSRYSIFMERRLDTGHKR